MKRTLDIRFFGPSLVSAWRHGASTRYRGLVAALHDLGHRVTWYEPDRIERRSWRDIPDPLWARVVPWAPTRDGAAAAVEDAAGGDVVVKVADIGAQDALLEAAIVAARRPDAITVLWDADRRLRPHVARPTSLDAWDLVVARSVGALDGLRARGARQCVAVPCAIDPCVHRPRRPTGGLEADLLLVGHHRGPHMRRITRVLRDAAARQPELRVAIAGTGWETVALPESATALGYVGGFELHALYARARAAWCPTDGAPGGAPPTQLLEAAGLERCAFTDAWDGLPAYFEPDREVIVAEDGADLADRVAALDPATAAGVGARARARVLGEHTWHHRATALEALLDGALAPEPGGVGLLLRAATPR